MSKDLTIAILCYNEENSLEQVTNSLIEEATLLKINFEILIIDDGSNLETKNKIKSILDKNSQCKLVEHKENLGLGYAYRSGFEKAEGQNLIFFPADGQFPSFQIKNFYEQIKKSDLVLGYFENQKRKNLISQFLSFTERVLYKIIIGSMPKFQGLFMIKTYILKETKLNTFGRGWGVLLELFIKVYRNKKYKILNIPNIIKEREFGKSKVNNLKTIHANILEMLKMRKNLNKDQI